MNIESLQYEEQDLSYRIIGAAIEVHKSLGPGLLESAYESCLSYEFADRGLKFQKQPSLSVEYKGKLIDCGYRLDFLIEDSVILEIKSVEKIIQVHEAQLLTYLKLSHRRIGILINFNVNILKDGVRRFIL